MRKGAYWNVCLLASENVAKEGQTRQWEIEWYADINLFTKTKIVGFWMTYDVNEVDQSARAGCKWSDLEIAFRYVFFTKILYHILNKFFKNHSSTKVVHLLQPNNTKQKLQVCINVHREKKNWQLQKLLGCKTGTWLML